MHFTIVTATFNRARTLARTHESICAQTYRDFDWLVVDDGSTDETAELVQRWRAAGRVPEINYVHKDNGGKHSAWRVALERARGPYLAEIDSDDELVPRALEIYARHWRRLEQREDFDRFLDVRALCCKPDGSPLTHHRFPEDAWVANLLDAVFDHRFYFEQAASWQLQRLRDGAPIPDRFRYDDRAKNFSEGIRWSRAARKYDTLFINEVVRVYHTDAENSYCRGFNLHNPDRFYNNIVGDLYFVDENIDHFARWPSHFVKAMLRYTSNCLVADRGLAEQYGNWSSAPSRALWLATLPAGLGAYLVKKALLELDLPGARSCESW